MLSRGEQMDRTVLEIFDVLEKLFEAQEILEQLMKDGFFNMSRARYCMGLKRVSADQILDADLIASRTVLVSEQEETGRAEVSDEPSLPNQEVEKEKSQMFALHEALDIVNSSTSKTSPQKDVGSDVISKPDSGLRKRNVKDTDKRGDGEEPEKAKVSEDRSQGLKEEGSETVEADCESEKEERPKKQFNPLNLFGVLVPRELRTTQHRFMEAVAKTVQISNLQHDLQRLQAQYRKLQDREA